MRVGDKVTIVATTQYATTEITASIEKFAKGRIYIKNVPSPFIRETGHKAETLFGATIYIKEIVEQVK